MQTLAIVMFSFFSVFVFTLLLRVTQIWVDTDKPVPKIGNLPVATPRQAGYALLITLEIMLVISIIYWVIIQD